MSNPVDKIQARIRGLTQERVNGGTAPASVLSVLMPHAESGTDGESCEVSAGFGSTTDVAACDTTTHATSNAPDHNTVFRIASCTKSFTAVRALQLRDAGLLDLDQPVTELLPGLPRFVMPTASSHPPTPRMLLTMSGGLPTDDAWADRLESMSPSDFDALLAGGIRFSSVPGTRYEYANLGWAILGRIMEAIDGRPITAQIEAEVLDPLGLTGVRFAPPPGRRIAQGFAKRAVGWEQQAVTTPGAFSAIGGLFASTHDLLRWATWLRSAFTDNADDRVLCAASRREMQQLHRVNPETAFRSAAVVGYGYGLVVEHSPAEGHVVAHSGGYPGFSAHMRWSIDTGQAVCGLENAGYAGVHQAVKTVFSELVRDTQIATEHTASSTAAVAAAEPWLETLQATTKASALLLDPRNTELWQHTAREWFDSCVELDLSIAERQELVQQLSERMGMANAEPRVVYPTPASARWELGSDRHTLVMTLQMTPLIPPQIQRLDVSLSEVDNPDD